MPEIKIATLLPDATVLLSLSTEELAGVLLESLNSRVHQNGIFHRTTVIREAQPNVGAPSPYPQTLVPQVLTALTEAWTWLTAHGLISPDLEQGDNGWHFVTRMGRSITTSAQFQSFRHAAKFPRELLHPVIASVAWAEFSRGDYGTAVFKAFRQVEIGVRQGGGYAATDIGVPLMRKAFDATNGPLANQSEPQPEREALAHMFAGAIGSYKNSTSHRTVTMTDPHEAIETLLLASHLYRIAESRAAAIGVTLTP